MKTLMTASLIAIDIATMAGQRACSRTGSFRFEKVPLRREEGSAFNRFNLLCDAEIARKIGPLPAPF